MKQEQSELFAKYFANELNNQEKKDFQTWLAARDANRMLFEKAEKIWSEKQKSNALTDEAFLKSIGSDPKQSWSKINEQIEKEEQKQSWVSWTYRVAASIALVVGISWLLFQTNTQTDDFFASDSSLHHYQSVQDTVIVLNDSSKVWLNKNAVLHYPKTFNSDERIVALEGEGYFEVKRDESRPFLIQTTESVVEVLGTTFNVKAPDSSEEVVVTVASGSVSLANKNETNQKVVLTKGEVGVFNASNESIEKHQNDNQNYLSWKTGVFTFDNQPLLTVLKSLETYYQIPIVSDDETILLKTLTATFEKQSIDEVLSIICSVNNLDMNRVENRIILSKKK